MAPGRLMRVALLGVLVVAALVLFGCGSNEQGEDGAGPVGTRPAAGTRAPGSVLAEDNVPPAAIAARRELAAELGLEAEDVTVVLSEAVDWPDACLGVEQPGIECAQVIVPGHRIILEAEGQQYEFHTDRSGRTLVRVEQTRDAPTEAAALLAARREVALQLGTELDQVEVVLFEPKRWPDACLGAPEEDEACSQVLTPGYLVTVEAGGKQYQMRTDLDGTLVRADPAAEGTVEPPTVTPVEPTASPTSVVAEATAEPTAQPEPTVEVNLEGGALLEWQSAAGEDCLEARIFTDTVRYGPCGGELKEGLLSASMERPGQLADLVRTYAPFSTETPAGKLTLGGSGRIPATAAEQRMVAEWSSQVAQETAAGRSVGSSGLVLQWHREGGIAGFCDDLSVYATGYAYATDCSRQVIQTLGSRRLTADELAELYLWLDDLQPFEFQQNDPATADAMATSLYFTGRGDNAASEQDKAAMNQYASQIVARWAESTPVPSVQAQADVSVYGGPADTYPVIGEVFAGQNAMVTGVNRASTWWRVICPDGTLSNCWVSGDPNLTLPNVPPGATGLAPMDETGIYSAIVRQVYTVDHTFAEAPNFPKVYLLRADDIDAGNSPQADEIPIITPPIQRAIVAALADLPAEFEWVNSLEDVPRDEKGNVADNAAIITMGNIRPQPDGSLHVAASIYVGMLVAGGQTYVLEQVDGEWEITGISGPRWMS